MERERQFNTPSPVQALWPGMGALLYSQYGGACLVLVGGRVVVVNALGAGGGFWHLQHHDEEATS